MPPSITRSFTKLFPRELADSSWDNTGLLLEAVTPAAIPRVLLTIDLTSPVVDEAIAKKVSYIIAYHPFIFRGLKSITTADPQQRSLLRLVQANVSVYCPHTAIDAAVGGVNDWLSDLITPPTTTNNNTATTTPNTNNNTTTTTPTPTTTTTPLLPNKHPIENHLEGGMGRLVSYSSPRSIDSIINEIKLGTGLSHLQLALAEPHRASTNCTTTPAVSTVAVCAGSGASVFKDSPHRADLYFTGEMSHHDLLHYTQSGSSVIVCGHSNTERGYLPVLCKKLRAQFDRDGLEHVEILVSEKDKDPLEFV